MSNCATVPRRCAVIGNNNRAMQYCAAIVCKCVASCIILNKYVFFQIFTGLHTLALHILAYPCTDGPISAQFCAPIAIKSLILKYNRIKIIGSHIIRTYILKYKNKNLDDLTFSSSHATMPGPGSKSEIPENIVVKSRF